MADPKKQPKAPPPAPVPPPLELYAEVGDIVHWYPGGDHCERPLAAVVSKVGHETVIVANVFDSGLADVTPQDGCRHMTDPRLKNDPSGGGWRHKPWTLAVRRMLLEMGVLRWKLTAAGVFVLEFVPAEPKAVPGAPAAPAA